MWLLTKSNVYFSFCSKLKELDCVNTFCISTLLQENKWFQAAQRSQKALVLPNRHDGDIHSDLKVSRLPFPIKLSSVQKQGLEQKHLPAYIP